MFAPSLEEEKDGVFSGSAVIGDDGELKFYYTGHRWANGKDNTGGDWQVQMLAEPDNDELTSATKRGMVIDCPTDKVNHHYRDPKSGRPATSGTCLRCLLCREARPDVAVLLRRHGQVDL